MKSVKRSFIDVSVLKWIWRRWREKKLKKERKKPKKVEIFRVIINEEKTLTDIFIRMIVLNEFQPHNFIGRCLTFRLQINYCFSWFCLRSTFLHFYFVIFFLFKAFGVNFIFSFCLLLYSNVPWYQRVALIDNWITCEPCHKIKA